MEWKRVTQLLRFPAKSLERASWRGPVCWLGVLAIGLWMVSWLDPEVAKQWRRHRPMSLFQITALVTMVAAAFLGSYVVGLLLPWRGKSGRMCRAIAGTLGALPVGVYVTERLRETGLEYNYGPAVVGAIFCGLAAVLLYRDPFGTNRDDEDSPTEDRG